MGNLEKTILGGTSLVRIIIVVPSTLQLRSFGFGTLKMNLTSGVIANSLNGVSLRVGTNIWDPIVIEKKVNGIYTYSGLSVDVLDILAESLSFSYELVVPPDGEWGDFRDGNWTGLVGLIHRQEDDAALSLSPSYERSTVADWTVPYDYWYNGVAVKRVPAGFHLWSAFLSLFSWQESKDNVTRSVYRGMMTFAEDDPEVVSLDPEVQLKKVLEGHYAYLGESYTLEQWAADYCDVIALPQRLTGLESYNIFTQKNSTLTAKMDKVLLRLQDAGILSYFHNRWYPKRASCHRNSSSSTAISLVTVQGPLLLAVGGLVLATVVVVVELLYGRISRRNIFNCKTDPERK